MWISQLALSPEVEQAVLNELIPALYLERAAKKLPTTEKERSPRGASDDPRQPGSVAVQRG